MLRRVTREDLFAEGAPRLFTLPPGAPFIREVAAGLADAFSLADEPEALADALIYVPNRRSARALALALHEAAGGRTLLAPEIRALGDLETAEPPPGAEAALADLPPVIDPAERLGLLARLVQAFYEKREIDLPPASALAAARELASLLDQAALSPDTDWSLLESLITRSDLAHHWQDSVEFLRIITETWPNELAKREAMDPFARRLEAAKALAEAWTIAPHQGPVIVAGSTGAAPASRVLIAATLALPEGCVILPGLDRDIPQPVWRTLADVPSHPQHALAGLLSFLGRTPDTVADWPRRRDSTNAEARRKLMHEALAPADQTSGWLERLDELSGAEDAGSFAQAALSGLSLIETGDEIEEARAAALLLRETLETPERTAALVTPDAGLARQVSALMRQWDVRVAPSAGLPLLQTPAGSLAALVLDWLSDPSHPVRIAALLKHPLTIPPEGTARFERDCLRGPRVWQDADGLCEHARAQFNTGDDEALAPLDWLMGALAGAGLSEDDALAGPDLLERLAALMERLCLAPAPWSGEDGQKLSKLLADLALITGPLGALTPETASEIYKREAALLSVAEHGGDHPRLAIWGPLEARLQSADRIILAGLDEGVWPQQPGSDSFLPRSFRARLGLNDPDERIGLAAHDFAQLASTPEVILLSAKRRGDAPAVSSRWVWRLQTLARGALGADGARAALAPAPDADPRVWIEALDKVAPLKPDLARPAPTPPLAARPKRLSVTRIELLQRDPYAIYASHVLKLRKLDALDLPADARHRGTAIHAALERFELDDTLEQTPETLSTLIETALEDAGDDAASILGLRAARLKTATDYLDWRQARIAARERFATEISGARDFDIDGTVFTLSAQADRIDVMKDGTLSILDFKSGQPPGEKEVRIGLNPQMPLQALIAQAGGFGRDGEKIPPAQVSELLYARFGSKFDLRRIGDAKGKDIPEMPVEDIIVDAEAGLRTLIARFLNPDHPYTSQPRPKWSTHESDYVRLARRDEWAGVSGDD